MVILIIFIWKVGGMDQGVKLFLVKKQQLLKLWGSRLCLVIFMVWTMFLILCSDMIIKWSFSQSIRECLCLMLVFCELVDAQKDNTIV